MTASITELTPLLKRGFNWGPWPPPCPSASPWPVGTPPAGLRLIPGNHPQRRGQSPRPPPHRTPAAQCRFRGDLPPGGLRLVGVNYPGPPPAGPPSSPWSFSTGTSMSCWWAPPVSARASSPKPWATPPSAPDTPCASATPTFFFKALTQARVDNSVDRAFRSFLTPDLLILDDLGLHGLTAQQSADLYELILNRHRASSFIITSNRAVDEWLGLFDDPILGNSALDRLANASYQIVIDLWHFQLPGTALATPRSHWPQRG